MIIAIILFACRYPYKPLPPEHTPLLLHALPVLLQKIQHIRHYASRQPPTHPPTQHNRVLTMLRLEGMSVLRRKTRHREIPLIVERHDRVIGAVGLPIFLARARVVFPAHPAT